MGKIIQMATNYHNNQMKLDDDPPSHGGWMGCPLTHETQAQNMNPPFFGNKNTVDFRSGKTKVIIFSKSK